MMIYFWASFFVFMIETMVVRKDRMHMQQATHEIFIACVLVAVFWPLLIVYVPFHWLVDDADCEDENND